MRYRRSLFTAAGATRTGDGRTVTVRLVAWDTPAMVTDDGRAYYREQFRRSGLQVPPDVALLPASDEHFGREVGRIVAVDDAPDALYADVRVIDGREGDAILERVDAGELSVSVEFDDFDITEPPADGADVVHTRAVIRGVAFTDHPQHTTAAVLGRRSHGGHNMENEQNPDAELEDEQTDPDLELEDDETTDDTAPVTAAAAAGAVAGAATVTTRSTPRTSPRLPAARPTSRFRSFGHFASEAANGRVSFEERARYFRALAVGGITDANSELAKVQWISELIDLTRNYTPVLQTVQSRPLPEKGLTIKQNIVDVRPLVDKFTEMVDADGAGPGTALVPGSVASRAASVLEVSWAVDTYGGGQKFTLAEMRRAEPDYLNMVLGMYTIEAAKKLETDVTAGLYAASDDVNTSVIELSNTAADFVDAFLDADDVILGALDRGAEIAWINRRMRLKLGKAKDSTGRLLFPHVAGAVESQGTMSIATTDGTIKNLRWILCPRMVNDVATAVVGVPEAYRAMVGPLGTMQADDPETLTHDHAVFQFAAHGKVDARGLVRIRDAA